jgi:hypothetical protein
MIENQLSLLVLDRLVAVESGKDGDLGYVTLETIIRRTVLISNKLKFSSSLMILCFITFAMHVAGLAQILLK